MVKFPGSPKSTDEIWLSEIKILQKYDKPSWGTAFSLVPSVTNYSTISKSLRTFQRHFASTLTHLKNMVYRKRYIVQQGNKGDLKNGMWKIIFLELVRVNWVFLVTKRPIKTFKSPF